MKIVACGAGGLIGRRLAAALIKDHELVRLVRSESRRSEALGRELLWDPLKATDWVSEIGNADAVINLSGEPIVGRRWGRRQKKRLKDSRILTTKAVVDAIAASARRPKVFLSASAIGYYGPRGDEPLTEASGPGRGFLPGLCVEWENEALRAEGLGVRTVCLRTGIVLAREGGALAKMLPPFRMFIGGPLGNGRQTISWIHVDDEVRAIVSALENPNIRGPLNLTAPCAVSMKEFAARIGKTLHRPAVFPVPGFALRLLLGEMSQVLLTGQNAVPEKLLSAGFRFRFARLDQALEDLFPKNRL